MREAEVAEMTRDPDGVVTIQFHDPASRLRARLAEFEQAARGCWPSRPAAFPTSAGKWFALAFSAFTSPSRTPGACWLVFIDRRSGGPRGDAPSLESVPHPSVQGPNFLWVPCHQIVPAFPGGETIGTAIALLIGGAGWPLPRSR